MSRLTNPNRVNIMSRHLQLFIMPLIAVMGAVMSIVLVPYGAQGATIFEDAIVYYDFEETGQAVLDQSTTTAINLQLGSTGGVDANDPARTAGKSGSGLGFTLANGDIATSDSDQNALDFDGGDPFTVAGWFRRPDNAVTLSQLVTKMDTPGSYPGWLFNWRGSSTSANANGIELLLRDNAGGASDGLLAVRSEAVVTTDWVHLAATYDGSATVGGIQLYADGQLLGLGSDANNTQDVSFETTSVTNNNAPFNIGGRNNIGNFDGFADDVAVWDRVLTQSEILEAMAIVPEPSGIALVGLAILSVALRRRRIESI